MKLEPSLETLQPQIELRVILGSQAGSRLTLAPGDYALGSGDDCSIILMGPKIETMHARLSFDGETPSITPLEGKVFDAQGKEIEDTLALALGMPIEIGGIWISIDDVDAEWPNPTDVVPIMPAAASEAAVAAPQDPLAAPDPAKSVGAKWVFISAVVLLSLAALSAAGFLVWMDTTDQQKHKAPAQMQVPATTPPSMRKVRDIVATSGVGSAVEISATRDQRVLVKGFVPDEKTKLVLIQALAEVKPAPKIDLVIDTELKETAVRLITEKIDPNRAKLRVESVSGGILTIEGAVLTQSVRESVMDLLHAGVPGIKRVNASIILTEDLPQLLQDHLADSGLLKKMQIIERQPEFLIRGNLNEEEMQRWETLIVNFSERYGRLLPVKATIKLSFRKPPVNVQAIVGGNMPFVVTESGDRVTRGGDINGNTLLTVKDNEIVFEGSERFRIAR